MTKLRVAIHAKTDFRNEDFALEAPDIATALTIADINVALTHRASTQPSSPSPAGLLLSWT